MFTPEELEGMPEEIRYIFTQLEQDLMSDIVDRIAAINEISRTADFGISKLYGLGMSSNGIRQTVQDKLKLADAEVDRIYDKVIKDGYARNEDIYTKVNKEFVPFYKNEILQQLVKAAKEQTKGELRNITQTTGFRIRAGKDLIYTPMTEHFQRVLDKSMVEILTGSFDYNKVLKNTVKQMTDSGVRTVDYESGHTDRIEVAARRAVMTGVTQVVSKITEDNAEALGTEYFEISWHSTARPSHQIWQGRVYHKDELATVCGLGSIAGLCGINCYHSYDPFIPGVSERVYTDEELDRMNEAENTPREFRDKQYTRYQAAQYQRRLERIMRAQRQEIKLLEKGGADEADIIAAKCRYRSASQEYTEFSKAMEMPQQRERIYMDGLGRAGGISKQEYSRINKTVSDNMPVKISQINMNDIDNVLKKYNDKIRNSDVEHAYAIDKNGNVYYSKGDEGNVNLPDIDLDKAYITHNHPKQNGVVSFGKDDFEALQSRQSISRLMAVNEKYDYTVSVLKDISGLSYTEYYTRALNSINPFDYKGDLQHDVFEILKKEGYIDYERKTVDRRTKN